MRKQNRPNQTARKQMQNLTVELFSRNKTQTTRLSLVDEALTISPTPTTTTAVSQSPPRSEPIPELVQILLDPETERQPKKEEQPKKADKPLVVEQPNTENNEDVAKEAPPPEIFVLEGVMTAEEAISCAQRIAEEEQLEAEEKQAKEREKQEEQYVTPPPLQRVPYEAQKSDLANIRAVTESMNIAAIPAQSEPMSFAACVRKMPSIETMSLAASPYAKFDGKSNPFASGGGGGFSKESKPFPTNPFANRKRYEYDGDATFNNGRSFDRGTDGFSSKQRVIPRGSESSGTVSTWWKSRTFSSANSQFSHSPRPSIGGQLSVSSKNMTTLNIPSHGHVEDLDGFMPASTQSTSTYNNKRNDLTLKKERWARMKAKKRLLRRPVEDEYYEDPDEEEEILQGRGVMLNHIVQQGSTGNYEDADLLRKFRRDVAYVKEHVMKTVDGNIDGIRDLRFLLGSVQTYGNIDGECMMAELALNEFSLFSGIMEKFHAYVGPWQAENDVQRRRASRHAFETHRIPLQHNLATLTKRRLIEEILGRVEPSIACHQGVRVGLYNENCEERTRVDLNIKNNFKDPGMLCDRNDRRFILVLQSELELMVDSMRHLAKTVGLQYEGFPINHNRFVIIEAFVEAIADIMGERIDVETMRWFSLLGQKVDSEGGTSPWDNGTDFHCARHAEPKSNYCAAVTVGRTCCIVYHVLGGFFRRFHLKRIPTANMIPAYYGPH